MRYYRHRGGYQFGSTRMIVKLEHLLFAGVAVVFLSFICLVITATVQLGYGEWVISAFTGFLNFLAPIPWYVFLATLLIGALFLWLAGGRGE